MDPASVQRREQLGERHRLVHGHKYGHDDGGVDDLPLLVPMAMRALVRWQPPDDPLPEEVQYKDANHDGERRQEAQKALARLRRVAAADAVGRR